MDADEIVIHEVKRHRVSMVFHFLAERIRQSGHAPSGNLAKPRPLLETWRPCSWQTPPIPAQSGPPFSSVPFVVPAKH
jgi:hypothetical protein